ESLAAEVTAARRGLVVCRRHFRRRVRPWGQSAVFGGVVSAGPPGGLSGAATRGGRRRSGQLGERSVECCGVNSGAGFAGFLVPARGGGEGAWCGAVSP